MSMVADRNIAEKIADKVEEKLYDGISTKNILQSIFKFLSVYEPITKHLLDLKKGLSIMDSKPEFEASQLKLVLIRYIIPNNDVNDFGKETNQLCYKQNLFVNYASIDSHKI